MKISDLNGDSTASNIRFGNNIVRCNFADGQTGIEYLISVSTQLLFSQASMERNSVHIRLINLSEKLPVEKASQIYKLPDDFGTQMQAAREGFHLAVGLKAAEWPLFLQIRGYKILVACPVQSEESIIIEPV